MEGSFVTVRIIEARNLRLQASDGTCDPYVVVTVEDQRAETRFKENTVNPRWDETFTMNVDKGYDPLKLMILDRDLYSEDDFLGKAIIQLDAFRDQLKHDQWFELESQSEGERWQGEVRLELQWIHSRVAFFTDLVKRLDEILVHDQEEKKTIESHLKRLREPFGFMQFVEPGHDSLGDIELAYKANQGSLDARFEIGQKRAARSLDSLGETFGYRIVPWYSWAVTLLSLYTFLTLLVMYHRPDFVNMTICCVAIYMLTNPETVYER